jgi:hypothetical protein
MNSRSNGAGGAELAATNCALDACAALLRAENADRDRQVRCRELDAGIAGELERLEALASWVESTMGPILGATGGKPAAGSQAAAAAIARCAEQAIAKQRQAIRENRDAEARKISRGFDARSLRLVLERYLSHFDIPGTRWQLRWQLRGDGGLPSATTQAAAPGEIEAEFPIALPPGEPWWQASRLDNGAPAAREVKIAVGEPRGLAPSKLWIVELVWRMGTGALHVSRHRKKASGLIRLSFPGDGVALATPVGADGTAMGAATPQDPTTNLYLQGIWSRLSSAAGGLVRDRGTATAIRFAGADLDQLESPARMAAAILRAIGPGFRELRDRLEQHRPEVLERLADKLADLPDEYRAVLETEGPGDPGPQTEDELLVTSQISPLAPHLTSHLDEGMPTMPFLGYRDDPDGEGDALFAASTVERSVDSLDLEVEGGKKESTIPGYSPIL